MKQNIFCHFFTYLSHSLILFFCGSKLSHLVGGEVKNLFTFPLSAFLFLLIEDIETYWLWIFQESYLLSFHFKFFIIMGQFRKALVGGESCVNALSIELPYLKQKRKRSSVKVCFLSSSYILLSFLDSFFKHFLWHTSCKKEKHIRVSSSIMITDFFSYILQCIHSLLLTFSPGFVCWWFPEQFRFERKVRLKVFSEWIFRLSNRRKILLNRKLFLFDRLRRILCLKVFREMEGSVCSYREIMRHVLKLYASYLPCLAFDRPTIVEIYRSFMFNVFPRKSGIDL